MIRFMNLGLVLVPSIAAYGIPQREVLPRQVASNSTFAPSTTSSLSSATATSDSNKVTITSAPLPTVSASANGTCPTSYSANFPYWPFAELTETCSSTQARELYDKFYYYTDKCLISYCEAQWTSTWYQIATAPTTTVWTTETRTYFEGIRGSGSLSTVFVTESYETRTFSYTVEAAHLVTLKPPCCGQCRFNDPTIQLYFWPTTAAEPTPSVTGLPANATVAVTGLPSNVKGTYVDDDGFTFTSPSLYLAFTHLGAKDSCGPKGTEIYNTTIGFDPTELSTMFTQETRATCTITGTSRNGKVYTTTGVDVTMPSPSPLTIADVAQDCSTIEGYKWFAENPSNNVGGGAGDPCHPVIALPTRIQELQPEWANCYPVYGGFYDPPKTLKQGTALVPTTAAPESSQADPTPSARPEPSQGDPSTPQDPAPGEPEEPSSAPQQPDDPAPGSSTTIVITLPPSDPSSPSTPDAPSAPEITIGPNPVPNNPNVPDPSPGNVNPTNTPVITLQPTIIPPENAALPGPGSTVIVIGTQTLFPGGVITVGGSTSTLANGQTIVTGGTQLVLDPQGIQVIIGGTSTVNLPPAVTAQPTPVITIGSEIITPAPSGPIVIGGQTLLPGSTIVVDGTTVSLSPGGTQLVVDGSTLALPGSAQTAAPLVITVGSKTLTADSLTQFTIGDQTLTAGGTIVESGTTYVLTTNAEGSTVLVAGTAGASSAASRSATATGAEESTSKPSSGASRSASRTGGESSTTSENDPAGPSPSGNGVVRSVGGQWNLISLLTFVTSWVLILT